MRDATKRRATRRAGEFLREYALLIAVFYPLDVYLQSTALTVGQLITTLLISGSLWTIGVILDVFSADD